MASSRLRTRPAAPCSTTAPTIDSWTAPSPASHVTPTSPPTSSSASAARRARPPTSSRARACSGSPSPPERGGGGGGGEGSRPLVLTIQECGGIGKTVEAGVRAVAELLPRANDVRRVPLTADKIILGTNCGGSDGNSGVTANPALGVASDLLVAQGGTSIIGETSEIYGAEHLLTRRAVSRAVGEKLIERIKWWEWYTGVWGAETNNNPSPGNKDGGLTTIYEKSLGAIAKGGSTALVDVVGYAEAVRAKGLVVMDTPGYDPVSMTGIVAGGANVFVL